MKVLKEFTFAARAVKASKYEWDTWADGKIRQLEGGEGKDFTCKAGALIAQARSQAKKKGLALRASLLKDQNAVVLQFFKPEPKEETAKDAPAKKK